jgi:hypothetical protein
LNASTARPHEVTAAELADWDHRAVRSPGGHVYQSTVWAEQRARLGWQPLYVMVDGDHPALVLTRSFPIVGGSSAYIPRGPIVAPADIGDGGEAAIASLPSRIGSSSVAWPSSRPTPRSRPTLPTGPVCVEPASTRYRRYSLRATG